MKRIVLGLALALVSSVFGGDTFLYSKDSGVSYYGPRQCPTVGFSLQTNKAVFNLPLKTDVEKAECGWFRVVKPELVIETNQYFTVTGYIFNVSAGIATEIGVIKTKPTYKTITKYSKLAIYEAACKLGKWADLETIMKTTDIEGINIYNAWTFAQYFTDENPLFSTVVSGIGAQLGLTDAQLQELLKSCEDGTERVLVDGDGKVIERGARVPRRFRTK